jgi:hypothetical protein
VQQTQARAYEPYVHELRAELARRRGDTALASARSAKRTLFTAIGATGHAARVAKALGS